MAYADDVIIVRQHPRTGTCVVYDLTVPSVSNELTDYGIYMSDALRLSKRTVSQTLYRLARFLGYIRSKNLFWPDVDDRLIGEFATTDLALVKSHASHRGTVRSAILTVNQKINAILQLFIWLQNRGTLTQGTIGHTKCLITITPNSSRHRARTTASPLYLKGGGKSSRAPYVPRSVYESAHEINIDSQHSIFHSLRNALFMDIAVTSGLRRGSICSLTIDQFPREKLEIWADGTFPVVPRVQKLNYENTFEFPTSLALRVLDFIEGPRKHFLEKTGFSVHGTKDAIFLSERTGKPISEQSMSKAIGKAIRLAGGTKGQAIHVLRGLFTNEAIEEEAIFRANHGLDTSTASISHAVAWRLGHKNPNSLFDYVARVQSKRVNPRR